MAYDDRLAERVRAELAPLRDTGEIKMFGGLCFTVKGNMCVGVVRDELMVRLDPSRYEEAIARPGARAMDFTGRPMHGFVFVSADGIRTATMLRRWIRLALDFVEPMPPKAPRKKEPRAPVAARKAPAKKTTAKQTTAKKPAKGRAR